MSKEKPKPPAADIRAFCAKTRETPEVAETFFSQPLENYYNDEGVIEKEKRRARYEQELYVIFLKYVEEENDLCEDSLIAFFHDIGVDPEDDYAALGVAWVQEIATLGEITKLEFCKGFARLELNTVDKMKKHFSKLEDLMKKEFAHFYDFCFQQCKADSTARHADVATAMAVWQVLLAKIPKFKTQEFFLQFIEAKQDSITISFDFWQSVLRFAQFIKDDYSKYSINDSWNSGIDAYVAWLVELQEEGE